MCSPFKAIRRKNFRSLLEILEKCREYAIQSDDSDWCRMGAKEIEAKLASAISSIKKGEPPDTKTLKLLFAPTGALQETAMSNGWADEYLRLAEKFDALISLAV